MNDILYNKKLLSKYDPTFLEEYLFIDELNSEENFKIVKHSRKILTIHNLSRYIYLSTLNVSENDYGYLLTCASALINLSKVGDNVYYLSYIEYEDKLELYSILHTFITMKNCYIDINKYAHLFDDYQNIYLHKKSK